MQSQSRRKKESLKVILDSNAFFIPLQFKIDIFEELERVANTSIDPVLLKPVQQELEELIREGSPKMQKDASYALKLAQKCMLMEAKEQEGVSTDDIIVSVARKHRLPVLTNDRQLRKRLRDINVPVIYVRQKSRLEIDGRL
jgi:rRNA-processing protein FCF1